MLGSHSGILPYKLVVVIPDNDKLRDERLNSDITKLNVTA